MTVKYKELAYVLETFSNYDDRLWKLLKGYDFEYPHIDNFDYAALFPYFVLSGATIEPSYVGSEEQNTLVIKIKIDESKEEEFYRKLLNYLSRFPYKINLF